MPYFSVRDNRSFPRNVKVSQHEPKAAMANKNSGLIITQKQRDTRCCVPYRATVSYVPVAYRSNNPNTGNPLTSRCIPLSKARDQSSNHLSRTVSRRVSRRCSSGRLSGLSLAIYSGHLPLHTDRMLQSLRISLSSSMFSA